MADKEIKNKYENKQIKPRVTEKASFLQQGNVYAFEIDSTLTKRGVVKAIKEIHKVTPLKVNIVRNPAKKISMKGKWGKSGGVKKAYVFLKKGDKIEQ